MVFPVISVVLQAKRARNCLSAAGSKAPLWDWSLTWSGIPGISLIRLGGEIMIRSYRIISPLWYIYIYNIIMHIYIYIDVFLHILYLLLIHEYMLFLIYWWYMRIHDVQLIVGYVLDIIQLLASSLIHCPHCKFKTRPLDVETWKPTMFESFP